MYEFPMYIKKSMPCLCAFTSYERVLTLWSPMRSLYFPRETKRHALYHQTSWTTSPTNWLTLPPLTLKFFNTDWGSRKHLASANWLKSCHTLSPLLTKPKLSCLFLSLHFTLFIFHSSRNQIQPKLGPLQLNHEDLSFCLSYPPSFPVLLSFTLVLGRWGISPKRISDEKASTP